jgi:hypothetical protein
MLDRISVPKIQDRIAEINVELKKLKLLEEEKAELEKVELLVAEYCSLEGMSHLPLFTDQSRRFLDFLRRFPLLALYLGYQKSFNLCGAYNSDNLVGTKRSSLEFYAESLANSLFPSKKKEIEELVQRYKKDEEKKAKTGSVVVSVR